jgi:hypothetical protein
MSDVYTRGPYESPPINDDDLITEYDVAEKIKISTNNSVYVSQAGGGFFAIHQFRVEASDMTNIKVQWDGRSSLAPTISSVVMQVYMFGLQEWTTVATESLEAANTDFLMTCTLDDITQLYKNPMGDIVFRVYQYGGILT